MKSIQTLGGNDYFPHRTLTLPPRSLTGTVCFLIPQLQDLDNWEIKTTQSEFIKTFLGFLDFYIQLSAPMRCSCFLVWRKTRWMNPGIFHNVGVNRAMCLSLFPSSYINNTTSLNTTHTIQRHARKMFGWCQVSMRSVSNMGVRIKDLYLFYQSVYSRQHAHTLITSVAISCSLRWNKLHVVNWKFH